MCKKLIVVVSLFLTIIVSTNAANDIDIDTDKLVDKFKDTFPDIKIDKFDTNSLPIEETKNIFREKCLKVSQTDSAFVEAEAATEKLKDCVTGLVDIAQLQKEMEEAQPNGELDTVFNKYCRKRTIAIECMTNFTQSIEPCLEEKEKEGKESIVNIFKNVLNFICHKDGDQIALFISEKGPECFTEKKDAIYACGNSTLGKYVPKETPTLADLPQLVMGVEQCNDFHNLQECVVAELNKCSETTPGNLVESMFKFIRKETPCANMTTAAQRSSVATSLQSISTTLLATTLMALTSWIILQ